MKRLALLLLLTGVQKYVFLAKRLAELDDDQEIYDLLIAVENHVGHWKVLLRAMSR